MIKTERTQTPNFLSAVLVANCASMDLKVPNISRHISASLN